MSDQNEPKWEYINEQFGETRYYAFPILYPTYSPDYARKAYKRAWRAIRMQKESPKNLDHFLMIHGKYGEKAWANWHNREFQFIGWANVARGLVFATMKVFKKEIDHAM